MDEVANAQLIIPADCGRSALLHVDLLDRENGEGSAFQHAMRVASSQSEERKQADCPDATRMERAAP